MAKKGKVDPEALPKAVYHGQVVGVIAEHRVTSDILTLGRRRRRLQVGNQMLKQAPPPYLCVRAAFA